MLKRQHKKAIKLQYFLLLLVILLGGFFIFSDNFAKAQVPQFLNYQGRLTDSSGEAITTATSIQFSIYSATSTGAYTDAASQSGPLLWKEVYDQDSGDCAKITPDSNGYFSVKLGNCTSLPSYLDFNSSLYLSIRVATDSEATPRITLGSHPFSLNSDAVDTFSATSTATAGQLLALDDDLGFDINMGTYSGGSFSMSSSTAISTVMGGITISGNTSLAGATSTSLYTSMLGINSEYITNLTGLGLEISSGSLKVATSSLGLTSNEITEGTNLYYTDARVGDYITGSSTIKSFVNYLTLNSGNLSYLNGNLSIGTTTATANLNIAAGEGDIFGFYNSTGDKIFKVTNNGFLAVGTSTLDATLNIQKFGSGIDILHISENTAGDLLVVDSDGNVGIGTTTPATKLQIETTGSDALRIGYNALNYNDIYTDSNGYLNFSQTSSGAVNRITFAQDGNTTTEWHARNNNTGTGAAALFIAESNSAQAIFGATGSGYNPGVGTHLAGKTFFADYNGTGVVIGSNGGDFKIYTGGLLTSNEALSIDTSGNLGIGTSSPYKKLSVDGDAVITGNLTVSGMTSTSSISAPYFTATDSSASSTFAGSVNVSGDISSPGLGNYSENFGSGASAGGQWSLAVGRNASTNYQSSLVLGVGSQTTASHQLVAGHKEGNFYADTFFRDNSTTLGGSWVEDEYSSGCIEVESSQLKFDNNPTRGIAYIDEIFSDNQYSQMTKNIDGIGTNGVGVRISGTYTNAYGYFALYNDYIGILYLRKCDNQKLDQCTQLDSYSIDALAGKTLKIEANGTTINVYLDDSLVMTAEDSTISSGKIGIGAYDTLNSDDYWDNFEGGDLEVVDFSITDVYFGSGVNNTDPVSTIFHGTNGSGTDLAGASLTFSGGQSTGTGLGGSLIFQTSTASSTSGTSLNTLSDRMVINSTGNIGIGTSTPYSKLTVWGGSGNLFEAVNSASSTLMVINSNGNIGIGTTTPWKKLSVAGDMSLIGAFFDSSAASGTSGMVLQSTASGTQWIATSTLGFLGENADLYDSRSDIGIGNSVNASNEGVAIGYIADGNMLGVAVGYSTEGYQSGVAVGYDADGGTSGVAVGRESVGRNYGAAVGYNARGMNKGVAIGYRAGASISTIGDLANIVIGYRAGDNITTGANNIYLGYDIEAASTTASNTLNIGNLLFGTGINGTGTTLSSGNIGIGTSTPYAKLSVVATSTGLTEDVFVVSTSTSGAIFKVQGSGEVYADGAFNSTGADYAEYYYTKDIDLEPGELVCVDTERENAVKRCENLADGNLMGIVSSDPSIVGNSKNYYRNNPNYVIVGMLGQVVTKVSTENGDIRSGDSLTSSSEAGIAMRANAGDPTVGVALEALDSSTGIINVLISRKNKSVTVEEVEDQITERIAAMEIEDEVNIMISSALDDLNIDTEISEVLDPQLYAVNEKIEKEIEQRKLAVNSLGDSLSSIQILVDSISGDLTQEINELRNNLVGLDYLKKGILVDSNFASSSLAFMNVDSDGNIGIGIDSPLYKLHVNGNVGADSFVNVLGEKVSLDFETEDTLIESFDNIDLSDSTTLPFEILDQNGNGVDLYKMNLYLLNILKAKENSIAPNSLEVDYETLNNDSLVINTLEVAEDSIFKGLVKIEKEVTLGKDSVGQVQIVEGDQEIYVEFEEEYQNTPIISLTLASNIILDSYFVKEASSTGFIIGIEPEMEEDVLINWQAVSITEDDFEVKKSREEEVAIPELAPVVEELGAQEEETIFEEDLGEENYEEEDPTSPEGEEDVLEETNQDTTEPGVDDTNISDDNAAASKTDEQVSDTDDTVEENGAGVGENSPEEPVVLDGIIEGGEESN